MNRPELYQKTVDVLLDAYNSRELKHALCTACAVGNICKEASQITGISKGAWSVLFATTTSLVQMEYESESLKESVYAAYKLINATGYTKQELMKIEYAFEKEGYSDNQYPGLCRVLDVLKEIHETEQEVSNDNQVKLSSIYKTKHYETIKQTASI